MTTFPDRDLRQRDLVPPESLAACRASVIGVGAIGRQVALQLAAMGVPWLQLVDFDQVEAANLGCQGYLEEDLGKLKSEATGAMVRRINSQVEMDLVPERFRRSLRTGDVVFCCVDSIVTRQRIWEALGHSVRFFSDARMSAEVLRVLTVTNKAGRLHYPTTLFAADEAFSGSCTAKSTIYSSNIAAGMVLSQFTKWLRGMFTDADLTLNLLAGELVMADSAVLNNNSQIR